jgi:hypothetical protein
MYASKRSGIEKYMRRKTAASSRVSLAVLALVSRLGSRYGDEAGLGGPKRLAS